MLIRIGDHLMYSLKPHNITLNCFMQLIDDFEAVVYRLGLFYLISDKFCGKSFKRGNSIGFKQIEPD